MGPAFGHHLKRVQPELLVFKMIKILKIYIKIKNKQLINK